jgi:Mg/Co/Ni transporter MgtE
MIAAAPSIAGWQFIALKPAMGFDFVTQYEDLKLDPRTIWFLPIVNQANPGALVLRFGIPNLRAEQLRQAQNGILVVLDTALGERSAATAFQQFDVVPLPAVPEKAGYIELTDLPACLVWRERRSPPVT